VKRVRGRRIDGIEGEDDKNENERVEPGVSEGDADVAAEERASFAAFGTSRKCFFRRRQ